VTWQSLCHGLQEDLNVTLTAISQLWNAADFLARLPRPDSSGGGAPGAAAAQQHGIVDRSYYADLLEVLFNALQASSWAVRLVQVAL
jgi:hypothetical protein